MKRLLGRLLRGVAWTIGGLVALIALTLLALTLYGRGSLESGFAKALKKGVMSYLGYEGPLMTFWGQPTIWVEASATHGYAGNATRLQILDLTHPDRIESIAEIDVPGIVHGFALLEEEGLLYVAGGDAGLEVVDVSDPSAPVTLAGFPSLGYSFGVNLSEDRRRLYIADRDGGMRIFDLGDPRSPRRIGTFRHTLWANDVVVAGTTAYLGDAHRGLVVLDVSDPENPVERSVLTLPEPATPPPFEPIDPPPLSLETADGLVYMAGVDRDLLIADVSDPDAPRIVGSLSLPGETMDLRVRGSLAYLAQEPFGLAIVDVSDPAAPVEVSRLPVFGSAHSLAFTGPDGSRILLGLLGQGTALVDVTDPATPVLVARRRPPAALRDAEVAADGRTLFTAEGPGGLGVFDLEADPSRPRRLATLPTTDNVYDVQIAPGRPDLLYLGAGQEGLVIVDVADRAAPRKLAVVDTPEHAFAVALTGDGRAFTAEGMVRFVGVDVSDPAAPVALAAGEKDGYGFDVEVVGERLLVANLPGGVEVLDLAGGEPQPPLVWKGPRKVRSIAPAGDGLVYLVSYRGGLQALDLTDPSLPTLRGSTRVADYNAAADVEAGLAAVAAYGDGLWLVDVGDPDAPRRRGSAPTHGVAHGVALGTGASAGWAYVADDVAGLTVVDVSDPDRPRALPPLPSPGAPAGDAVLAGAGGTP